MYDRARLPFVAWVAKDKESVKLLVRTFDQRENFCLIMQSPSQILMDEVLQT